MSLEAFLPDDAERRLETVMQNHLPIALERGEVMCLCHATGRDALFEGPVFHRRHVAALQIEALQADDWTPDGEFAKSHPDWAEAKDAELARELGLP